MIVRIQKAGGSFTGAGQYYLHDKAADKTLAAHLKPKTDERVWFTETRNCLAQDPERAFVEMWRTAEDQMWLKKQAGVRTSGRVCGDPVKTLSLSWHKEDAPSPEHMIETADAFLKHMGWEAHQAVYVGHQDTEHRHIHIILNRVHPETGRTLDDYREQVRSQKWASLYEKEHGRIWCEQRENNARARDEQLLDQHRQRAAAGENVVVFSKEPRAAENAAEAAPSPQPKEPAKPANDHLPHNVVMMTRPLEKQFTKDEKARDERDQIDRDLLKDEQRAEREAYFKDGAKLFKETRHAVYDEVRKEYAPEWRQFYKDQAAAVRDAEAWSKSAVSRAFYFASRGQWAEAKEAFNYRDSVRDAVAKEFAQRKAELKSRQMEELRERQKEACDALRQSRDLDYKELLQRQRKERNAKGISRAQRQQERKEYTADLVTQTLPVTVANENVNPEARTPDPVNVNASPMQEAVRHAATHDRITLFPLPQVDLQPEKVVEVSKQAATAERCTTLGSLCQ
jgi:hypothetical protein